MAKKKQRINLIDQNGNSQVVQVNSKELYDNESKATKATKNTTVKSTVKNAVKGGLSQADKLSYAPLVTAASTVNGALGGTKDKKGHTLGENALQVGKNTASGLFSGLTSIPDSQLYETRNNLQKGEKKAEETTNAKDSTKELLKSGGKSLLYTLSPTLGQVVDNVTPSEQVEGNAFERALKKAKKSTDFLGGKQGINKTIEALGQAYSENQERTGGNDKLSTKVENLQAKIDKPADSFAQQVQEENQNYSKPVQFLGATGQTVGNMVPSMVISAATGNPNAGLSTMYYQAKGAATKEALQKGADLDTALAIGTAKGGVEVGTEKLTGGIKIKGKSVYGQGTLDDMVESTVNKLIKNKTANFLVKQIGTANLGEILEETISDVVGTIIDRNTTDPNASYSLKDWGNTALQTMASTMVLNLLGGSFGKTAYNQNAQELTEYQNNQIMDVLKALTPEDIQNVVMNTANIINLKVEQGKITTEQGQLLLDTLQENTQNLLEQQQLLQSENGQMQFDLNNQNTIENKMEIVQNLNDVERAALVEVTQKIKNGQQLDIDDIATLDYLNSKQSPQTVENTPIQEEITQPNAIPQEEQINKKEANKIDIKEPEYQDNLGPIAQKVDDALMKLQGKTEGENYIGIKKAPTMQETVEGKLKQRQEYLNDTLNKLSPVKNVAQNDNKLPINTNNKLQNYRNSLEKENIEDRDGFFKAFEKIIKDKDYNVVFDSSITNEKGQSVNAVISNEDGITIKINPQSERASEILLMHEVTHGIETKEMRNLIMDYAKKNTEFNDALEDLKKAYGTEDVTPEVVADISGQLFGNQEFINNLSTKNPSLFKRILDAIRELANKLTGNKDYNRFIKDLQVKWERAYRQSNIESAQQNLKEGAKYSQNAEMTDITDSDGDKLSKGQVDFFDESKARDEDGNLVKVYHTTTGPVIQFNEFNPVGTPGYKFGNNVVNYYTSSKEMSGSYDESNSYEMAETKRLNNIEEAQQWLDELGIGDITIEGNEVYEDGIDPVLKYKTTNELLRNLKRDIQKEYGNALPIQYQGYLNMKKPFVVDATGKKWSQVVVELDQEVEKVSKQMEKYKTKLHELAEESEKKYQEYLGNASFNRDIARKIITYSNSDLLSIDHDGILGFVDNYKEFYDKSKEFEMEYDIPEPGTPMSDIVDYWDLQDLKEDYDEYYVDNFANMTIDEFIKEYHDLYEEYLNAGAPQAWFENNYKKIIDDHIKANVISDNSWYYISKANFDRKTIEEHGSGKSYETNDIVKKIIEENKDKIESEKYDGVIFKNVVDYGWGRVENHDPHDVYVTFASNQFKAVDNLNPTNDPDIRYSKYADKWQEFLEKNFKSRGTTTKAKDYIKEVPKQGPALADVGKTEKKVVKQPSTDTKEFKEAQQKVKNGTATMKERKYIKTATEAQNTKNLIKDMDDVAKNYEVLANKTSMNKAKTQLSGFDTVEDKANYISSLLTSGKRITAADITAAQLVLKDAAATKNGKLYTDVLADTSILATEYGQVLQAMSQIRKLSPTSQLDVLEKIIKREKAKGNKGYSELKITDEMRDRVLDCYDSNGNINQEKFDETMNDIKQELADKIKVGVAEKMRAWRYLSMLGNPKTHVRNMVANVAMSVVKGTKDKVSGLGQDIFVRNKANKTRTLKFASKEVKSLATQAYNEIKGETKGNKYNEESDLDNRKTIFKFKPLEKVRKWNDVALSAEDQAFKKINFKKSFANYLTAQGISTAQDIKNNPDIIEKAKQFATIEADVATFNQANKLSEFLNSADNKLGGTGKVIRGAIIPFTRTPLNIAKTGIEYTPGIGAFTTLSEWKNAPDNMKGAALIDGMSKQMTGGALALLGYVLAKAGIVTAGSGDDKEDKFEKDQGSTMDYSIKIGDTSYDLSWLSPSSMPFFVGSRMFEVLDKQQGINENLIVESLASTLDPLSEMSVVQSFTDVLSSYSQEGTGKIKDMAVSTMQSYLSQYIPTLAGQFARFFDDTKRTTMADTGSSHKISQETARKLQYKIPGLRNMLPESTDYYGREKKEYNEGVISKTTGEENIIDRIYNSFLSPVNKKKDTMSEEDKELIRLYKKTGNDDIIPYSMKQSVQFNDNNYQMTRSEFNDYKKDFGDSYIKNVKSLMQTYDYKQASDDEKAEMIAGIMKYAKDKAKDNYLTDKGEDYVKISEKGERTPYESDKVDEIIGKHYGIYDYYAYKVNAPNVVSGKVEAQKTKLNFARTFGISPKTYSKFLEDVGDMSADVDENGKTIQNSKKRKIYNYINSMNLSGEQKTALFKQKYKQKSTNRAYYNKINDTDLTVEEKESLSKFLKIN